MNILLIEDNSDDVVLIRKSFERSTVRTIIDSVKDGIEALDFLNTRNVPDLILLDINMPRMNGMEFLKELQKSKYKYIPVIVLTTSESERDIFQSYNLSANSYVTKPLDYREFIDIVKKIEDFWMKTAKLPKKSIEGFQFAAA